jgi:sec-independent protein translocase protein TatA
MALTDPIQWIVIGVIVVVIFLWGPQKIPDIARALGRAKKEFDQAQKEVGGMVTSSASGESAPPARPAAEMTGDQMLVETARRLGISTEGKTREQVSQEIVDKVKAQQ